MEAAPQPGTELNERYRLIRPLARGGMGSVWRAEHLTLNAEVAVKIIDPALAQLDMGLSRFMREARALAALHSPYIVQVIDFGSQGDIVYLVMELLEGKTLGQRLKAEGKLSAAETQRVLCDVCKAMSHAHDRGIIHRDLKPDNIFLCDESREHVTKVLDFGIAKPRVLEGVGDADTSAGAFLGTPSYMSPEQCRGEPIDPRSDLWAIGAIAYECLSGEKLFGGSVLGILVRICNAELQVASDAELPPGFVPWLKKAMAVDPGQRFQSAAELFAALAPVLSHAPRPVRGVDSAETLSDAASPVSDLPPPSASSSTLAHATVAKVAHRNEGRKRASLLGFVAGSLFAALAVFALLRHRASLTGGEPDQPPPVAASTPEGSAKTPVVVGELPDLARQAASSGAAGASTTDAGVLAAPAEPATKPGARDGKQRATNELRAKPPRRNAPQRTPLEMEQLRKRR